MIEEIKKKYWSAWEDVWKRYTDHGKNDDWNQAQKVFRIKNLTIAIIDQLSDLQHYNSENQSF